VGQAIEDAAGRFTVPERWWEAKASTGMSASQAAPKSQGGKKKPGGK
jgi:hypothetical protein